ncbi:DUF695 domain-containing protein [Litoribacillus peritrichatus]|uniref:DUF695 domain-containing protein n=1 Tax=Litoribacillus peritrichatus TaxID=718191 RepID=A0ABP7MEQ0_9GAMM
MTDEKITQYDVSIPKEEHGSLTWEEHKMPAYCSVNKALAHFKHKEVFGWHLAIVIECEAQLTTGQPTPEEKEIVDKFCGALVTKLTEENNALFLAKSTWNGCYNLFLRVYDPYVADDYLKSVLEQETNPREMEYHMEQDKEWKFAQHYIKPFEKTDIM